MPFIQTTAPNTFVGDRSYPAGSVVEVPSDVAAHRIAGGQAVAVRPFASPAAASAWDTAVTSLNAALAQKATLESAADVAAAGSSAIALAAMTLRPA